MLPFNQFNVEQGGVMNSFKMGSLITFEGVDAARMDVLAIDFYRYLKKKKKDVVLIDEFKSSELSLKLRKILFSNVSSFNGSVKMDLASRFFLFLANRNEVIRNQVIPYLKNNSIVLFNRFNDYVVAYFKKEIAKRLRKPEGKYIDLFNVFCSFGCSYLKPDLTIFFSVKQDDIIKYSKNFWRFGVNVLGEQQALSQGYEKIYAHLDEKELEKKNIMRLYGTYEKSNRKKTCKELYEKVKKLRSTDS